MGTLIHSPSFQMQRSEEHRVLFINDLPSSVSSSVKLFADDSVLYRHIESSPDHDKLQQGLLLLDEWVAMWQLRS